MQIRKGSELIKPVSLQTSVDETADVSAVVDSQGFNSALLSIGWEAPLTSGEAISFKVEVCSSTDNSTFSAYSTLQATTAVYTAGSTATFAGTCNLLIDMSGLSRYLKFKITCTTATGTNNDVYASTLILCDPRTAPVAITFTS